MAEASSRILKSLGVIAGVHGRATLDRGVVNAYAEDLALYPESQVLHALDRCRRELRTFPTIADIIARIDDGRPGAEEAWAMIPKDEAGSVVWTAEMRDAYAVARSLLPGDPIAARMAFKETYEKLTVGARARQDRATWSPTLGHDLEQRGPAIRFALDRGRITHDQAQKLLADPGGRESTLALPAPESVPKAELRQISDLLGTILSHAPESTQRRERIRRNLLGDVPARQESVDPTPEQIDRRKRELLEQARVIESENKGDA